MVQRYAPAIAGLQKSEVFDETVNARWKQLATNKLRVIERFIPPNFDSPGNFSCNEKLNYFKLGPKFRGWHEAFLRETWTHLLILSNSLEHRWKQIMCSYEDVRKVPPTSSLQEARNLRFFLPDPIPQSWDFQIFSQMEIFEILLHHSMRWKYNMLRVKRNFKVDFKPVRRSTSDIKN